MKLLNFKFKTVLILISSLLIFSCKQEEWLDAKRIKSDVRPETLKDYQAILDNNQWMNGRFISVGLVASDNIYVTDLTFGTLRYNEQQIYLWGNDPWSDNNGSAIEWNNLYAIIEYANIVLDGLENLKESSPEFSNIKGQALFYRSFALYNLALIFCPQYITDRATTQKGLPLRNTSDVNITFKRSDLKLTYEQILNDASNAAMLLPEDQSYLTRPSKFSAFGLLAKVNLTISDFHNAKNFADKYLEKKSNLLDFNSDKVSLNKTYRFPVNGVGNPEVDFYAHSSSSGLVRPTTTTKGNVDSILYRSYKDDDLRKSLFYFSNNGIVRFRGGYTGDFYNFSGIATNEVLLIKSECLARSNDYSSAMELLNTLLIKRYKTGTFKNFNASNKEQALDIILEERRKELPFTFNVRWDDIRRLSSDPVRKIGLKRIINGKETLLTAGSLRYAFPIPGNEIVLSGVEQNDY